MQHLFHLSLVLSFGAWLVSADPLGSGSGSGFGSGSGSGSGDGQASGRWNCYALDFRVIDECR